MNLPLEMRIYVSDPAKLDIGIDCGHSEVICGWFDETTHHYTSGHISRYDLAKLEEWEW